MRHIYRALRTIARSSAYAMACVLCVLSVLGACQDITAKLPAGSVDPSSYTTPEAAEEMARNARYQFQLALFDFMTDAGRITDELTFEASQSLVTGVFNRDVVLDQRHLPDETLQGTLVGIEISTIRSYPRLQTVRGVASLARRALATYAPQSPAAFRGEMFVYEAFAEVMLADLYCSGIPLSTVDFNGDYTYLPGSSTPDVYQHAVMLFDSAIALASQDETVRSLARVGKGRALLALGRYAEASAAVSDIPASFTYDIPIMGIVVKSASNVTGNPWAGAGLQRLMVVANRKGQIGLPFITPRDPRAPLDSTNASSLDRYPRRRDRFVVASGIEAELIRAEALLYAGSAEYLTVLNALRTTCTSAVGCATPPAGTGGVAGLPPLSDPGTDTARVSLLFRERAFWLFFTGHRQGDLRRLIRHYGRTVETVYPQGDHPGGIGFFDQFVDVPMPAGERHNPYYGGCLSRGA